MHDRPLPQQRQQRELEPLRQERQTEVEMEDVRLRREARERAPLRHLLSEQPTVPLEVDIGLGMQAVPVEHDEPGVDAPRAQRLHVRPRDARGVDRTVGDPQLSHSTWSK